jgi:ribose transport system substrate-binding protein
MKDERATALRRLALSSLSVVLLLGAAACGSTATGSSGSSGFALGAKFNPASVKVTAGPFVNQKDYETEIAEMEATPQGPSDAPWEQMIDPTMVSTAQYAKPGPWHVCFSNAGVTNNPWRVVGLTTMEQQVKLEPQIGTFTVADAGFDDNNQISDIQQLLNEQCDLLIVSANTTDALTPEVEAACATGIPVITFDRGVNSSCPVSFVSPIGGYAFGAAGATFIAQHVKKGGNVVIVEDTPGVDVLAQRDAVASAIFKAAGLHVVGEAYTNLDNAQTKTFIDDTVEKYGHIDGVFMDAGAAGVAIINAFQELNLPVPVISGEDQNNFLEAVVNDHLTAVAPVNSNFEWRTVIIDAVDVLSGKSVPKDWVVPQTTILPSEMSKYAAPALPPEFYAMCGCQGMPNFPQAWMNS